MCKPKKESKDKLVTWTRGDGEVQMQLDYLIISEKNKNWVKNRGVGEWGYKPDVPAQNNKNGDKHSTKSGKEKGGT